MTPARNTVVSFVILALALGAVASVVPAYTAAKRDEVIRKGPGVSEIRKLSAWFPGIAGTSGDTDVYVLDSGKPGATALVLGGTHGNEPAGYMTAIVIVENAVPASGRLLVVPHANRSSVTHTDYQEASPRVLTFQGASGRRTFRYGSRATNPTDQWPDPDIYVHAASGQQLSGAETRNLNRAYPGRADGTFTERVAYAITAMIRTERADVVIDLHEASPEYPVVNTMVAHQRAVDLAAVANMGLEPLGITIGLEPSPENLHGLSHREWGDATPALAVLMETTNPAQGRLRGRTDAALVVEGRDRFYALASSRGRLSVPFPGAGWPLAVRVARHVAGVQALVDALRDVSPDRGVRLSGVPEYGAIVGRGLGAFLRPRPAPDAGNATGTAAVSPRGLP
jgi:hypothetical protein